MTIQTFDERGPSLNEEKKKNFAQSFVQDDFFEKGHWGLKIRQVLINFFFMAILVLPIMILFNSLANGSLWKNLYSWNYQDGFDLSSYLQSSILFAAVVILVLSLAFLFRNNYRGQNVYLKKKTYDEEKLEARKKVLNEMYTTRFGNQEFRETTRYFVVEGEQNLPDKFVSDLFKKNGVEIK